MRLSQRTVAIVLSDQGRAALQLAAVSLADSPALLAYIQDTDDIGLWVRVRREDGEHVLLVRWEYVLSVDFMAGESKTVGLKP